MSVTRDGKLWRSQFYYEDWQGKRDKKNKRGFKTKGEAEAWGRDILQYAIWHYSQRKNVSIH